MLKRVGVTVEFKYLSRNPKPTPAMVRIRHAVNPQSKMDQEVALEQWKQVELLLADRPLFKLTEPVSENVTEESAKAALLNCVPERDRLHRLMELALEYH